MQENDPHDLARFVVAQEAVIETALRELRAGQKKSHWMWFVFPQLAGLGFSAMAQRYAIADLAQARSYLAHPVLGERLLACTMAVNQITGRSLREIFGAPDDLKFHSSVSLFNLADPGAPAFSAALRKYFATKLDLATQEKLRIR